MFITFEYLEGCGVFALFLSQLMESCRRLRTVACLQCKLGQKWWMKNNRLC